MAQDLQFGRGVQIESKVEKKRDTETAENLEAIKKHKSLEEKYLGVPFVSPPGSLSNWVWSFFSNYK